MPPLPKKVAAQQRCHGFGLHLAIAMAWAGSASVAINHRISRDLFSEGRVICTTSIGVLRRKLRTTTFAARHGRKEGNRGMNVTTRQVYYFEDLEVGMEASFAKTVTAADIVAFAEVTGDKNPVHLDAAYAARTIFKEPIAHGMLTAGYISAVFGMELPGPGAIYVSQTLNFRGPVKVGDRVVAKVRVMELYPAKRRARFESICTVDGKAVLEGEAVLMVPTRPTTKAA
jgi:3-hydroxybutyryl-CoA dehydratase